MVCYDESLNKIQEPETHLGIKTWDNISNKVQLLKRINDGRTGLNLSKQIELLMNGPSINRKVLNDKTEKKGSWFM